MQVTVWQAICLPAWQWGGCPLAIYNLFGWTAFDLPTFRFFDLHRGLRFRLPMRVQLSQNDDQQGSYRNGNGKPHKQANQNSEQGYDRFHMVLTF